MTPPKNLEECFIRLKEVLYLEEIEILRQNLNAPIELHHSLGRWIRNNWGLWSDSELKEYFKNLGLSHPDDMSGLILKSFYRHLNNLPLEIEAQVQSYKDYWDKINSLEENFYLLVGSDGEISVLNKQEAEDFKSGKEI